MNNNKEVNTFLVVLIVIACAVLVGVSYAAWSMNAKQTNTNIVSTVCFETTSDLGTGDENNGISLLNSDPMSDADGMATTGFTFTIKNVCRNFATYQVNLETLASSTLGVENIRVALDSNYPRFLTDYDPATKHLQTASSSYTLATGGLMQNETKTYTLRLWIPDSIEYSTALSNKTYSSKIVIKSVDAHITSGLYVYYTEESSPLNSDNYNIGDEIEYTIHVKNISSSTLNDISIDCLDSGDSLTVNSLASGVEYSEPLSHYVIEDDIHSNSFTDEASIIAYDSSLNEFAESATKTFKNIAAPSPNITIEAEETSTPLNGTSYQSGETISFDLTMKNEGNVTLYGKTDNIHFSINGTNSLNQITELAPNINEDMTYNYTVLASDITAGKKIFTFQAKDAVSQENVEVQSEVITITINF